jgi:hypothetical protein
MIGKHFLVTDIKKPWLKRQYTICNCMNPDVYAEYCRMIREFLTQGTYTPAKSSHFEEKDGNQLVLTMKNYGHKKGLSTAISDSLNTDSAYLVKGPMGTGLCASTSGTFIAVTAAQEF